MPLSKPELWQGIAARALPFRAIWGEGRKAARPCASLADNLARSGGWTDDSAATLVKEYRRLLYLRGLAGQEVHVPKLLAGVSGLLATMDDPEGQEIARAAKEARADRADATRALYQREFDSPPPRQVWPGRRDLRLATVTWWSFRVGFAGVVVIWLLFALGSMTLSLLGWANWVPPALQDLARQALASDLFDLALVGNVLGGGLRCLLAGVLPGQHS